MKHEQEIKQNEPTTAGTWKARYEEANHHLDLMVECYGIEALVELVESEEGIELEEVEESEVE